MSIRLTKLSGTVSKGKAETSAITVGCRSPKLSVSYHGDCLLFLLWKHGRQNFIWRNTVSALPNTHLLHREYQQNFTYIIPPQCARTSPLPSVSVTVSVSSGSMPVRHVWTTVIKSLNVTDWRVVFLRPNQNCVSRSGVRIATFLLVSEGFAQTKLNLMAIKQNSDVETLC